MNKGKAFHKLELSGLI